MADKAILWALISASTKEGRKACSLSYFACKAAEAELGLAYMAANDNKEFLTSLSNIMRYKIDAGLSESYTCYLLSKGKIIRPYLKNLNPHQLSLLLLPYWSKTAIRLFYYSSYILCLNFLGQFLFLMLLLLYSFLLFLQCLRW